MGVTALNKQKLNRILSVTCSLSSYVYQFCSFQQMLPLTNENWYLVSERKNLELILSNAPIVFLRVQSCFLTNFVAKFIVLGAAAVVSIPIGGCADYHVATVASFADKRFVVLSSTQHLRRMDHRVASTEAFFVSRLLVRKNTNRLISLHQDAFFYKFRLTHSTRINFFKTFIVARS